MVDVCIWKEEAVWCPVALSSNLHLNDRYLIDWYYCTSSVQWHNFAPKWQGWWHYLSRQIQYVWIRPSSSWWQWTLTFNCQKNDWHAGVIPGQTWWQPTSFTFWILLSNYGRSSGLWAGMTQTHMGALVSARHLSNLTSKQASEDIDSKGDQSKFYILKSFLLIVSNYTYWIVQGQV